MLLKSMCAGRVLVGATMLLVLLSTSHAAGKMIIPWQAGSDITPLLGLGFISRTGEVTEYQCVDGSPPPARKDISLGVVVDKKVKIVKDTESFRKFFSASASASVGSGPFSASGSASYSNETTSNSYHDRLLAQELVVRETENLLSPKLHAALPKSGSPEFIAQCGDRYIAGIIRGGRLQVEFSAKTVSDSSTTSAGGALSAAFSAFGAGGSATSVVSKASQHGAIDYRILENGGDIEQPVAKEGKAIDATDIAVFVDRYPDNFRTSTSHDLTVALVLKDYSGLDPAAALADPDQLKALDDYGKGYERVAAFVSGLQEIANSKGADPSADILLSDFGRVDAVKVKSLLADYEKQKQEILNASRACSKATTQEEVKADCDSAHAYAVASVPKMPRKEIVAPINSREWHDRSKQIGVTGPDEYFVISGKGGYEYNHAHDTRQWTFGWFKFLDAQSAERTELWNGPVPGEGCLVPPNTIVTYDYRDSELEDNWNIGDYSIILFEPLFVDDWKTRQKGCPSLDVGKEKRARTP